LGMSELIDAVLMMLPGFKPCQGAGSVAYIHVDS